MQREGEGTNAAFAATQWTMVLRAAERHGPGASEALETLCQTYWYPLYAFLRRSGHRPHEAQDFVQGFFAHLLAREGRLQSAQPAKGRFRSFLLGCLKHYVSNERAKDSAACRHPKAGIISIDETIAEERYHREPADIGDPAKLFERRWAMTLIEDSLRELKAAWTRSDKGKLFQVLCPYITGESERGDYAQAAAKAGLSEGALRTAATRLRGEFREALLKRIALTVDQPTEVDAEVSELFALFNE